jgi:glutathione S-transferase
VRLFMSLIGVDCELVGVDLRKDEHHRPWFLALNPFHQISVLQDADVVVSDSNAILVYLARKYHRTEWLPTGPADIRRGCARSLGSAACYGLERELGR